MARCRFFFKVQATRRWHAPWQCTLLAPTDAARLRSSSTTVPTRTTSSEPMARSEDLSCATLSVSRTAAAGLLVARPVCAKGRSKTKTGRRNADFFAAASRAALSSKRRSVLHIWHGPLPTPLIRYLRAAAVLKQSNALTPSGDTRPLQSRGIPEPKEGDSKWGPRRGSCRLAMSPLCALCGRALPLTIALLRVTVLCLRALSSW